VGYQIILLNFKRKIELNYGLLDYNILQHEFLNILLHFLIILREILFLKTETSLEIYLTSLNLQKYLLYYFIKLYRQ
jgi:hypothetical protein